MTLTKVMQLIRLMKEELLVTAMMLAVCLLYTVTTIAVLSALTIDASPALKAFANLFSFAIFWGMYLITNTSFLVLESKTAYEHYHKKVALVYFLFFIFTGFMLWIIIPIGSGWLWLASLLLIVFSLTIFQWAVNRDN